MRVDSPRSIEEVVMRVDVLEQSAPLLATTKQG
jgi:hypothetical protein